MTAMTAMTAILNGLQMATDGYSRCPEDLVVVFVWFPAKLFSLCC